METFIIRCRKVNPYTYKPTSKQQNRINLTIKKCHLKDTAQIATNYFNLMVNSKSYVMIAKMKEINLETLEIEIKMKNTQIKKICPCYGNKDHFMKLTKCNNCQFKKRCLLRCNSKEVFDVFN